MKLTRTYALLLTLMLLWGQVVYGVAEVPQSTAGMPQISMDTAIGMLDSMDCADCDSSASNCVDNCQMEKSCGVQAQASVFLPAVLPSDIKLAELISIVPVSDYSFQTLPAIFHPPRL